MCDCGRCEAPAETEGPDFWVIEFTGIDGRPYELVNKFTAPGRAEVWAAGMPAWQEPRVVPMWDG